MKRTVKPFLSLILCCLLTTSALATDVPSEIKEVHVYPSGASIFRETTVILQKGQNTIRFYGISPSIDPNTIQLDADQKIGIQSISYQYDYLKPVKPSQEISALQDTINAMEQRRNRINALQRVYTAEKQFLTNNAQLGNQQVSSQAEEYDKMAGVLRKRLREIELGMFRLEQQKGEIYQQIQRRQEQIAELQGMSPDKTGIIELQLLANAAQNAKIELRYFVRNAGWRPIYEMRFSDVNSPIAIQYNAMVQQHTGIEWKDVKLVLSTSTPSVGSAPPTLHPWRLYYKSPRNYSNANQAILNSYSYEEKAKETSIRGGRTDGNTTLVEDDVEAEVFENMVALEFQVPQSYSIASNQKDHLIKLKERDVDATFNYLAIPKLETEAFLVANITDWYKLNLLPGASNMFIGNTYVGQSYINPEMSNDTLAIGFGRDKMVQIQRQLLSRECKKGFIAGKQKHELQFEIVVRNLHKQKISLTILDQIPTSSIEEIEVEAQNISGAKREPTTGQLTWEEEVDAGATAKFTFSFTVKHPRNKVVYPLNNVQ